MRSIKEVERMNRTHNCGKVIKGNTDEHVNTNSYIVMMKRNANMSEMVSSLGSCICTSIEAIITAI